MWYWVSFRQECSMQSAVRQKRLEIAPQTDEHRTAEEGWVPQWKARRPSQPETPGRPIEERATNESEDRAIATGMCPVELRENLRGHKQRHTNLSGGPRVREYCLVPFEPQSITAASDEAPHGTRGWHPVGPLSLEAHRRGCCGYRRCRA